MKSEIAQSIKSAASLWKIPVAVIRIAKAAGCKAFVGSRIRRTDLERWLAKNPEATRAGEEKAHESELRRRKLQNEVTLGNLRIANEEAKTIPRDVAKSEWARALAIVHDEAKVILEAGHYRIFIDRITLRIGSMHEV